MLSNNKQEPADVFIFDGTDRSDAEIYAFIKSSISCQTESLNADVFTYCDRTLVFVYRAAPLIECNVSVRLNRKR